MMDGVSAYPVVELVTDGSAATVKACALCIAEAWERVTGWRFANLLASMRMGSEIGKLTRATNKEARRGRRTKTRGGDGIVPESGPVGPDGDFGEEVDTVTVADVLERRPEGD